MLEGMADPTGPPMVRVGVLGPLQLIVAGEPVGVPGPKRQALLALLALAEGQAVTVGSLVEVLWPGETDTGRRSLHSHVSRLRGHLGDAAGHLRTLQGAYLLALQDDGLDAARARRLLSAARSRWTAIPPQPGISCGRRASCGAVRHWSA
jgi:DNA-binding SARP family transcriptional activator